MSNKIISTNQAANIANRLRKDNKKIVLIGGCFDILHIGHIKFLENAKKQGNYLFVLLESDDTVRKLKSKERPINSQKDRAEILASISFVDFVVILKEMRSNTDYDQLILKLKPDVIATTKGDPQAIHNLRQAKKINAKVIYVTKRIKDKSTTKLAQIIYRNFR